MQHGFIQTLRAQTAAHKHHNRLFGVKIAHLQGFVFVAVFQPIGQNRTDIANFLRRAHIFNRVYKSSEKLADKGQGHFIGQPWG